MTILKTERLIMRPWKADDYKEFAALNADPKVMEYYPECLSEEHSNGLARSLSDYLDEKGYGLWALEEKNAGNFIGYTGLWEPSFESDFTPCFEIGWRLSYGYWGKGYATEAAVKAAFYAFEEVKLEEIVSFTARDNLRSRRVMEKLAMGYVKDFDHPHIDQDSPLNPHMLYRVTKEEFYAHHAT